MCAWPAASRATSRWTATSRSIPETVTVGGELKGNIENAKRVELLEGGIITGDVKAGSLTVAAGSRMRGQVEFGWDEEGKKSSLETKGFGTAT
jgi:cytoskeletal protein CcmA (bactofilin family)